MSSKNRYMSISCCTGEQFDALCRLIGLSDLDLAFMIGKSKKTVKAMRKGKAHVSPKTWNKIAEPIARLHERAEGRPKKKEAAGVSVMRLLMSGELLRDDTEIEKYKRRKKKLRKSIHLGETRPEDSASESGEVHMATQEPNATDTPPESVIGIIQQEWGDLVGPELTSQCFPKQLIDGVLRVVGESVTTGSVSVDSRTLSVEVMSHDWVKELRSREDELIELINQRFGEDTLLKVLAKPTEDLDAQTEELVLGQQSELESAELATDPQVLYLHRRFGASLPVVCDQFGIKAGAITKRAASALIQYAPMEIRLGESAAKRASRLRWASSQSAATERQRQFVGKLFEWDLLSVCGMYGINPAAMTPSEAGGLIGLAILQGRGQGWYSRDW